MEQPKRFLVLMLMQRRYFQTLKSIGDITMGNNEKFSSMTLAFAQMSAAGRLMGARFESDD